MSISVDPVTHVINVPQSYLTAVSAGLFNLDTNQLRKDLGAWAASVEGRTEPFPYDHNAEYTVAGVTYARKVELINGYSWQLEDTGTFYSVQLSGSNNNLFDVANGIFLPHGNVGLIPGNAAGLQVVSTGSGLSVEQDNLLTAIYIKAAQMIFTKTNELDVNVKSQNSATIAGTGISTDKWRGVE